jgi:hypothetical protein
MDIFDLLFIALFLTAVISLLTAGVSALLGRRARALRILQVLGVCTGIYFAIVCIVSAATPRKILNVGDPQCADDWCISVDRAERIPGNSSVAYDVSLHLWSRARRVAQRENHVVVHLTDDRSRRFDSIPQNSTIPFNILLQPGESVTTHRIFRLPVDARGVGAVVSREGSVLGCFPGCLVITENDWFHRPTVVRLD